jgi:hypothetical protein
VVVDDNMGSAGEIDVLRYQRRRKIGEVEIDVPALSNLACCPRQLSILPTTKGPRECDSERRRVVLEAAARCRRRSARRRDGGATARLGRRRRCARLTGGGGLRDRVAAVG